MRMVVDDNADGSLYDIRLEALKIASQAGGDQWQVIERAEAYVMFLCGAYQRMAATVGSSDTADPA